MRSDHSIPRPGDAPALSRTAPPRRGAYARGLAPRILDQSPDARGLDRDTHLQRPVADRVKTFVGTSANALHIQISTALIALPVLKYVQLKARFGWSLSNLVALLRMKLLVYRDLWAWLNDPFTTPPLAAPVQGALAFS